MAAELKIKSPEFLQDIARTLLIPTISYFQSSWEIVRTRWFGGLVGPLHPTHFQIDDADDQRLGRVIIKSAER